MSLKEWDIDYTIHIEGDNEPHEDKYDIFEKPADAQLPDTCIEAAEHALKCMKRGVGFHYGGRIKDDDTRFPAVYMQVVDGKELKKFDIDVEDMNEKSVEVFGNRASAHEPHGRPHRSHRAERNA